MSFLMQARSTTTGLLVAWLSSTPDFAGSGFPGPGLPEYVAVSALVTEGVGDGLTAPVSPTDNGKFPQAQSGDLTYITAAQLTADLNIFTSTLKGLTPASGGGTTNYLRADGSWSAPPGSLTPPTGGDDYKVAFGLSSDIAFATSVKLGTGGDSLLFGGTATTGALLNVPATANVLRARNAAGTGNVELLVWGSATDRLWVGDSSGLAGANILLKTGGDFSINVNGTPEYLFDATKLDMNGNNLLMGAGFASFGAAPSSIGALRLSNLQQIVWRNNAGTTDIACAQIDNGDNAVFGDRFNATAVYLDAKTGGVHHLRVNGTDEYTFNATALTMNANNILMGGGFVQFSGNTAAQGEIRFSASAGTHGIWWRNNANTADITGIFSGTDDVLYVGDNNNSVAMNLRVKTSGSFNLSVNAITEYSFSSTTADFKDNVLQFGTTPATAGTLRLANDVGLIAWRNAGNTANVLGPYLDSANSILIGAPNGGFSSPANMALYAASGGTIFLRVVTTDEYTFSATTADFKDNVLQFGTNPASAGTLRFANNLPITWRNAGNTTNVQGLTIATDNAVYLGDSANAAAAYVITAGGFGIRPNGVGTDAYTFTSTQANFRNSVLLLSSTPAASGVLRFGTNPGVMLATVNYDSTGDQQILQVGGNTTFSDLRLGDVSAKGTNSHYYQCKSQHLFVIGTGGTQQLIIDANKMFVHDTAAAPTTDPASGGYFYSEGGAGKWRGSSGTVTTFGPAEPHCPRCDRDFAHEWESTKYGKLSICVSCLVDALVNSGIPANEFVIERSVG